MRLQQTVVYGDESTTTVEDFSSERDPTFLSGTTTNVPLADFLSRPVVIYDDDWDLGVATQLGEFDPWTLFQNQPRIKAKLANFAFASFDLHLRFSVAGTPFQYGQIVAAYVPYALPYAAPASGGALTMEQARNQVEMAVRLTMDQAVEATKTAAYRYYSTYPHVVIEPQTSESKELVVPFVWHNNMLCVSGHNDPHHASARETLGVVRMFNRVYVQAANTSAPLSFNIKVTAWASNVHVSTPTEFEPTSSSNKPKDYKSKDEYGDGVVSAPASAVASAAGKLKDVPVIGPYARATEIGASTVSRVAKLLGFSAPRDLEPSQPRKMNLVGGLSNMLADDTSVSLACDPKQEVTVDPRTVGLAPVDEMSFASIVKREQWLTRALWTKGVGGFTSTAGAEKIVFASCVMPSHLTRLGHDGTTGHVNIGGHHYHPIMDTPMGHLSRMFGYWKGDIIYRVEVVASPYHRGKLKLQFDPFVKNGSYTVNDFHTDDINARYTAILDLTKTREVEFRIPWTSYRPYLRTYRTKSLTGRSTIDPIEYNQHQFMNVLYAYNNLQAQEMAMGVFIVSVFNELVAPVDTDSIANGKAPVFVNVYVKGGENMKFQQPHDEEWPSYFFRPGAGVYNPPAPTSGSSLPQDYYGDNTAEVHQLFEPRPCDDDELTFFGERVTSIRTLIKRYMHVSTRWPNHSWSTSLGAQERSITKLRYAWLNKNPRPAFHAGTDPWSQTLDMGHSFATYCSAAFLAVRGSTRRKLLYTPRAGVAPLKGDRLFVERKAFILNKIDGRGNDIHVGGIHNGLVTTTNVANSWNWYQAWPSGANGMDIQDWTVRPAIEVEMPYYSGTRFSLGVFLDYHTNELLEELYIDPANTQIHCLEVTNLGTWSKDSNAPCEEWFACGDDFSMFWYLAPPMIFYPLGASDPPE